MFIVFEGIDGTGKSTQAKLLSDWLTQKGIKHILTREPGGCPSAEDIRKLVLEKCFLPATDLLLMIAARNEHWHNTIKPALERQEWVICDRYIDSTRIYQGCLADIPQHVIDTIHDLLSLSVKPDHVFILTLDINKAMERIHVRLKKDRYDHFDRAYYKKLHDGFESLGNKGARYHLIDASRHIDEVHDDILRYLA